MNNQRASEFYTIKQVAALSGLPASTLRYYESIGIISPIARGKFSGQRQYSDDDLARIEALACLHATGLSLDDMRQYLLNFEQGRAGAAKQIELMKSQLAKLDKQEKLLKLRRRYIDLKIAYWQAVEQGDNDKRDDTARQAESLAQNLRAKDKEGK